jgi:hypothetical protein
MMMTFSSLLEKTVAFFFLFICLFYSRELAVCVERFLIWSGLAWPGLLCYAMLLSLSLSFLLDIYLPSYPQVFEHLAPD